jgi:hypothetical protein
MEAPRSRRVRVQQLFRSFLYLIWVLKKRLVGWRRVSAIPKRFSGRGTKRLHLSHLFRVFCRPVMHHSDTPGRSTATSSLDLASVHSLTSYMLLGAGLRP